MLNRLAVPTIKPGDEVREEHVCYGTFDGEGLRIIIHTALTRDQFMRIHLLSVNKLAYIWSDSLRLSSQERELLARAALLHDVGKILIPDPILQKPTKLTAEEYEIVKGHVELGERLVKTEPGFDEVATLVAQHHEWYDGSGYPRQLSYRETHPLARALSVVDAFSAMTDLRPYAQIGDPESALVELEKFAGSQFDPYYVESFVKMKRSRSNLRRV